VPRGKLFGVLDLNNVWAMYALVLAVSSADSPHPPRLHSPFGQVLKAIAKRG